MLIKNIFRKMEILALYCLDLHMHLSCSGGSHTFSTVQFENQYGKLPFSNIFPFGHLYFVNSTPYHIQPPSSTGGGFFGQGNTTLRKVLDVCI